MLISPTNLTFYWPKSNKLTNKQNKHYCNVGKTSVNINSIFTIIFNTNYPWCSMQAASDAWAEGSPAKHPLSLLGWDERSNTSKKHRKPSKGWMKGKSGGKCDYLKRETRGLSIFLFLWLFKKNLCLKHIRTYNTSFFFFVCIGVFYFLLTCINCTK